MKKIIKEELQFGKIFFMKQQELDSKHIFKFQLVELKLWYL